MRPTATTSVPLTRTRRFAARATAALLVIMLTSAVPAGLGRQAAHARQSCSTSGHVVASSRDGVVSEEPAPRSSSLTTITIGCWRATGRRTNLHIDGGGPDSLSGPVILAGRFALIPVDTAAATASFGTIQLWDLKVGRPRFIGNNDPSGMVGYDSSSGYNLLPSVVLRGDGVGAWIACTGDTNFDRCNVNPPIVAEINASRHVIALSAVAPDIAIHSLRLTRDRRHVTWKQGAKYRSAVLDRPSSH